MEKGPDGDNYYDNDYDLEKCIMMIGIIIITTIIIILIIINIISFDMSIITIAISTLIVYSVVLWLTRIVIFGILTAWENCL